MKIAVVGSRDFKDKEFVYDVLDLVLFHYGEFTVVTGLASGADTFGLHWANDRDVPFPEAYPADWGDLSHPDAVIKTRRNGHQYDAMAGMRRNQQIVDASDFVFAFMNPDNPTPGTSDTIERARRKGIQVFVLYPDKKPVVYERSLLNGYLFDEREDV